MSEDNNQKDAAYAPPSQAHIELKVNPITGNE